MNSQVFPAVLLLITATFTMKAESASAETSSAVSAADAADVVAGVVQDATGKPVKATVRLFLVPPSDGTKPLLVPLLASGATTPTGRFSLQIASTPALQTAANANGGYVNFQIAAYAKGMMTQFSFSRMASPTSRADAPWTAGLGAGEQPVPHLTLRLTEPVTKLWGPDAAAVVESPSVNPPPCVYQMDSTQSGVWTRIGEAHNWNPPDYADYHPPAVAPRITWEYGQTADSDVTVGYSQDGASWSASGTTHVGTSTGVTVGVEADAQHSDDYVRSQFQYTKYAGSAMFCPYPWMVKATEWQGGLQRDSGAPLNPNDGSYHDCYDATYQSRFDGPAMFDRIENEAGEEQVAASAFGFTFGARSGFSTTVRVHYDFPGAPDSSWSTPAYLLCGDTGYPVNSLHVYGGFFWIFKIAGMASASRQSPEAIRSKYLQER